jgi:outer membrane protein
MKKLTTLILGLTLATSAFAVKVGYVNSQELFQRYSQTQVVQNKLNTEKNKLENEIKQKEIALQKLQVEMQAKGDQATEAERKNFQTQIENFQNFVKDAQTKLSKEEYDSFQKIERTMNIAIQNVAKTDKYEYVFEAGAIKFGGDNITDKVLKTMESTTQVK